MKHIRPTSLGFTKATYVDQAHHQKAQYEYTIGYLPAGEHKRKVHQEIMQIKQVSFERHLI